MNLKIPHNKTTLLKSDSIITLFKKVVYKCKVLNYFIRQPAELLRFFPRMQERFQIPVRPVE